MYSHVVRDGLPCARHILAPPYGDCGPVYLRGCTFSVSAQTAEHIYIGMQLLSSLLLLGGGSFLSAYGPQLMSACAAYVGEVVERGLLLMLPPVDLLLVAAPQQAAPLVLPFMQVSTVAGRLVGWHNGL